MPLWLSIGVTGGIAAAVVFHRRPAAPSPFLWALAAVVLVASLAAGLAHALEQRARRPPVSEQQASIARGARNEHRRIVFSTAASLHGPGARKSEVVVLRDDRVPVPGSDELRVYDMVDGRLREVFRFLLQGAVQIRYLPKPDLREFRLVVDHPADIDRDGRSEVVVAFERVTQAGGPLTVPMLVAWDDATRRYRLSPVNVQPPRVRAREANTKPIVTVDRAASRRGSADAVTYKIVRSHPYAVLLGGYPDGDALLAGREQYELEVRTLDLKGGAVESVACLRPVVALSGRAGNDVVDTLVRWFGGHEPPGCEP